MKVNMGLFLCWNGIIQKGLAEIKNEGATFSSSECKAIGFENRSKIYPQLTDHYFTGDYPVKLVDELGDNKITQLSLLSSASNN